MRAEPKSAREKRERIAILKHKFDHRITTVRIGKHSYDKNDYLNAIRKYTDYLETIAEINETDLYSLRPDMFNMSQDVTELLLISHLYFELAKMYDSSEKFQDQSIKCLELFVSFTVNQPFQILNSEMIRKYVRRGGSKYPENFFKAYQQIHVQSKKCYVATYCYGETHAVTRELRLFKNWLLTLFWGHHAVRFYYSLSSKLIAELPAHPLLSRGIVFLSKPALKLFSKILPKTIINE